MKNLEKLQPGFSLIEILAVFFVVSMAMVGVVSLIIQNIQAQSINKNNLMAASLAQEGIELVRQTRDSNWRAGRAYDSDLSDGTYMIDYRQIKPLAVDSSGAKLYLQNGFYINQTGADAVATTTIFSRQIIIEKQIASIGQPLQIRSIIAWTDRQRPYTYELRTLLYNWK